MHTNTRKYLWISALFITCMTIGVLTAIYVNKQPAAPANIPHLLWPQPKLLGEFSTIDQFNQPFSLSRLHGNWSFLFFGYTHCPDICPVTLAVFDAIQAQLQAKHDSQAVQFVFVSVDPKRDSAERLREYLAYFNDTFIGLSGSMQDIDSLAKQIGVSYFHRPATTSDEYLVDHSASVFLIDPKGRLLAIFSAPQIAEEIVAEFAQIRTFIKEAK